MPKREKRRESVGVVHARHAPREQDDLLPTLWPQLDEGNPEGDDDPSEGWIFDTGCSETGGMFIRHR